MAMFAARNLSNSRFQRVVLEVRVFIFHSHALSLLFYRLSIENHATIAVWRSNRCTVHSTFRRELQQLHKPFVTITRRILFNNDVVFYWVHVLFFFFTQISRLSKRMPFLGQSSHGKYLKYAPHSRFVFSFWRVRLSEPSDLVY